VTEETTETIPPVLEFRGVTVRQRRRRRIELSDVTLRLEPGELVFIRVARAAPCPPLADVAEGLDEAAPGEVRFEGLAWSDHYPRQSAVRRGRIGRVFDGWGWISNLDVLENVLLAADYHGRAADHPRLVEKAQRLAQRAGLAEIPRDRPAFVSAADLRRAQWVRALLREPALLLLERPTRGVPPDGLEPLCQMVDQARQRGAAVVWLTSQDATWQRLSSTKRSRGLVIRGNRLGPETEHAA